MQKQMAAVSLDKEDLQQASHLQEQLQKALQDQHALSSRLQEEWQNQEHKLSIRYGCILVPLPLLCELQRHYRRMQQEKPPLQLFSTP